MDVRHEMLGEAIEVIRKLWSGDYVSHRGRHYTVEDARIFDLPDRSIAIVVAVSGPASLDLAAAAGAEGIMAIDPDPELIEGWARRGGDRDATWTEVPMSWDPDEQRAVELAHERFRFGLPGWKVMAELPNPVNFDAATALAEPRDTAAQVPCGPDPARHAEAVGAFVQAGYESVCLVPVADDVEGMLDAWEAEIRPRLG